MGIFNFINKPMPTGAAAAPAPWQQRVGLIGSTFKDIGASLGGHPEDAQNIAMFQQGQKQAEASAAANQAKAALSAALATRDPGQIKTAALAFAAAGGDLSNFATALKFGQPNIERVGDSLVSTDPFGSGQPTEVFRGATQPLVNGGMVSMDHGVTWKPIPGYIAQQGGIADARAAGTAAHRAPPKPKANTANPFGLTPPWQQFGGQ